MRRPHLFAAALVASAFLLIPSVSAGIQPPVRIVTNIDVGVEEGNCEQYTYDGDGPPDAGVEPLPPPSVYVVYTDPQTGQPREKSYTVCVHA